MHKFKNSKCIVIFLLLPANWEYSISSNCRVCTKFTNPIYAVTFAFMTWLTKFRYKGSVQTY